MKHDPVGKYLFRSFFASLHPDDAVREELLREAKAKYEAEEKDRLDRFR